MNELLTVLGLNNMQEYFDIVGKETGAKYLFVELNEKTCLYTKDGKTVERENEGIINNIVVTIKKNGSVLGEEEGGEIKDVLYDIDFEEGKLVGNSYKTGKKVDVLNPKKIKADDLGFIKRKDPSKIIKKIHESLTCDDDDIIKTISEELSVLEKKVVSITFEGDFIIIKTPPITINCVGSKANPNEKIEAGNYLLRINLFAREFNVGVVNCILEDAGRSYLENNHHPHHGGGHTLCLDEFSSITGKIWKNKNLTIIYDVMYEWLSTCNTEHGMYDRVAFYNDIQECLPKTA